MKFALQSDLPKFILLLALAGCGGGATTSGGALGEQNDPPKGNPDDPMDMQPEPTLISLISKGSGTGSISGNDILVVEGDFLTNGGVALIADGQSFNGAGAFGENGVMTGSGGQIRRIAGQGDFGTTVLFSGALIGNDVTGITHGIYGAPLGSGALRTTGTAVFTGFADAMLTRDAYTDQLNNGTARVTARFGDGEVDVDLFDFDAANDDPVDAISVVGMTLESDGSFSGGTVALSLGEEPVTLESVFFSDITTEAAGQMFGDVNGQGNPASVGGIVTVGGSNGGVSAGFVAN